MKHFRKTKIIALMLAIIIVFNFVLPTNEAHAAGIVEGIKNAISNVLKTVLGGILEPIFGGLLKDISVGVLNFLWSLVDNIAVILNDLFVDDHYASAAMEPDEEIVFSPDNIVLGKFALLNANIFKEIDDTDPNGDGDITIEESGYYDTEKSASGKNTLRANVAKWYYALRNFSIVALLSVLVYVAIRMVLSSISSDKAKYKMMLKDWAVAICLVIFMHFIMIALLDISTLITESIGGGSSGYDINDIRGKIATTLGQLSGEFSTISDSATIDGKTVTFSDKFGEAFANIFLEIAMIVFTVMFAVKYLIRAITIMFLAIIGPVTAITYPIDKISDGKAQAYNTWFKEFLYNAIIQPFHLLIYVVLISSASSLASTNILYCLVCYAAIIPSEKIIKQMFGIRNQSGGGDMGAIVKASAIASGLRNLGGKGGGKGSQGKVSKGGESKDSPELPPKQKDDKEIESYDNGGGDLPPGRDGGDTPPPPGDEDAPPVGDGDTPPPPADDADGSETTNTNVSKAKQVRRAIRAELAKKVRSKYGTTSKRKLLKKAGKKALGASTRFIARGAGAFIGGSIGLAAGLATGDFGGAVAAMTAGAGLGSRVGNKLDSATKTAVGGAVGLAKTGIAAAKGEDQQRKDAKKSFMNDQREIDYATARLREKNGGEFPSKKEVDEEMAKRWQFKENGIKDNNVIDGAIDLLDEKQADLDREPAHKAVSDKLATDKGYAKDYKELVSGNATDEAKAAFESKHGVGSAEAAISHSSGEKKAMTQTTIAARLASEYSKSDFRDEKKMTGLQKTMSEQYARQTNSSPEHSKDVVTRAIGDAAKIRGVKNPNLGNSSNRS